MAEIARAGGAEAGGAGGVALGIRERVVLTSEIHVAVTGRLVDPDEHGTRFGSSNLADHVGDDSTRVVARRALLAADVAVPTESLVFARAEHGVTIVPIDAPADRGLPGDGVITARTDVALMAMAADCVPFAVADPVSGVIAAVHAGWRGTAAGIVEHVLTAFAHVSDGSTRAADLIVYLGPAVCGGCYVVGPEVVEAVAEVSQGQAWRTELPDGHMGVDLRTALTAQLLGAGVRSERITRSLACTVEDPGFYSHRRDGAFGTGRHALVVHRVAA